MPHSWWLELECLRKQVHALARQLPNTLPHAEHARLSEQEQARYPSLTRVVSAILAVANQVRLAALKIPDEGLRQIVLEAASDQAIRQPDRLRAAVSLRELEERLFLVLHRELQERSLVYPPATEGSAQADGSSQQLCFSEGASPTSEQEESPRSVASPLRVVVLQEQMTLEVNGLRCEFGRAESRWEDLMTLVRSRLRGPGFVSLAKHRRQKLREHFRTRAGKPFLRACGGDGLNHLLEARRQLGLRLVAKPVLE